MASLEHRSIGILLIFFPLTSKAGLEIDEVRICFEHFDRFGGVARITVQSHPQMGSRQEESEEI